LHREQFYSDFGVDLGVTDGGAQQPDSVVEVDRGECVRRLQRGRGLVYDGPAGHPAAVGQRNVVDRVGAAMRAQRPLREGAPAAGAARDTLEPLRVEVDRVISKWCTC